jgi:hypothetical protein
MYITSIALASSNTIIQTNKKDSVVVDFIEYTSRLHRVDIEECLSNQIDSTLKSIQFMLN